MPTRNVNLTDHQDQFLNQALASGRYQNASEVVRDSLRLLEDRDREYALRLAGLKAALDEGEAAIAAGNYEDVAVADIDKWMANLTTAA